MEKVFSRNAAREVSFHILFALGFLNENAQSYLDYILTEEYFTAVSDEVPIYAVFPDEKQMSYIRTLVNGVFEHIPELDSYIEKYSIKWGIDRISRVSVAVMRLCMYEVLYMPEVPTASACDAAVRTIKKYEGQETAAFVNGIIGTFVRKEL